MTESWPPRWTGPQFKGAGSRKVARGLKREQRLAGENANKKAVRLRDTYCRFPLCGCKRFQLALHVAHVIHKGMGGNPAEDRSEPELMVLLCSARHRENVFSIDRGTLRWQPLTKAGSEGPIAWRIDVGEISRLDIPPLVRMALKSLPRVRWTELARETAIHVYEPTTPEQTVILTWLKTMER